MGSGGRNCLTLVSLHDINNPHCVCLRRYASDQNLCEESVGSPNPKLNVLNVCLDLWRSIEWLISLWNY